MKNEETIEVVFDKPDDIEGYWVSFVDAKGQTKYVPCSEKFFHEYRNMERNLKREELKGVVYEAYYPDRGWVRTTEPPAYDDGHIDLKIIKHASLEYLDEEYDLQFPDPTNPDDGVKASVDRNILNERVQKALEGFTAEERRIFELFYYQQKTDLEIAILVFKDESKRATVQRKKTAVFNAVIEFVKKFY